MKLLAVHGSQKFNFFKDKCALRNRQERDYKIQNPKSNVNRI